MSGSNIYMRMITERGPVIGEGLLQGWEGAVELKEFSWGMHVLKDPQEESVGNALASIAGMGKPVTEISAEAMRMLEAGVASVADIDRAMELGYRHPMGPLKLTDLVGLDASILMHPLVWKASGHVDHFTDPMVDCKLCKGRFRADHLDQLRCPKTPSKKPGECAGELTEPRSFNLMFKTYVGATASEDDVAYLRPETAQAMFVQFKNVLDTTSLKPPFGIAQHGKSFRNEVTVEHFIFRSCEFEQMEMEFFCEPGSQLKWMEYWKDQRMQWWHRYANYPQNFRFRAHAADELAHYADGCYDVEYFYPWGWDELEGIASRTDHDLHQHEEHSGQKLRYVDADQADPATGEKPWSYRPYVIEPAAGATRGVLCYLLDAYHEEERRTAKGETEIRTVLKLHPRLAPIKCAVLPLVQNKDEFVAKARSVMDAFLAAGVPARKGRNPGWAAGGSMV